MNSDLLETIWTAARPPDLAAADWESLLSQARCTRLASRLARLLRERGWQDAPPARARIQLDNAWRHACRQRDVALWEADRIAQALAALPGPVVLLKGAAYVVAGLPAGVGRIFSDVDLLVPRAQLREAEQALFAAGWIAARLNPYDERYYRDWSHELPPMEHVERQTSIDLHHTITPPTSRFAVDASPLIARARPLAGVPGLAVLAPADMVLHGVVHLMQEGEFGAGLRDLLDFDDLVRHFAADPAFWPELVERARDLRLQVPLVYAVDLAGRLFGLRPPAAQAAQLQALAPGRLRRAAMLGLLSTALRPEHPDCDRPFTGVARWLLYVRSHALRMPWYQILPHLARKSWMRAAARHEAGDRPAPRF